MTGFFYFNFVPDSQPEAGAASGDALSGRHCGCM